MSQTKNLNYRWEQCYEMHDGVYWAIVDDQSQTEGLVSSHLLVVHHCWADSLGIPFPKNEFPKRIVDLLNQDSESGERFFLDSDNDGHWYLIPCSKQCAWQDFLSIPEDDERSWDVPEFAKPLGGGPNSVTFQNPLGP